MKKTSVKCAYGWGDEMQVMYVPEYENIEFTIFNDDGLMVGMVSVRPQDIKKLLKDIETICADNNLTSR